MKHPENQAVGILGLTHKEEKRTGETVLAPRCIGDSNGHKVDVPINCAEEQSRSPGTEAREEGPGGGGGDSGCSRRRGGRSRERPVSRTEEVAGERANLRKFQ